MSRILSKKALEFTRAKSRPLLFSGNHRVKFPVSLDYGVTAVSGDDRFPLKCHSDRRRRHRILGQQLQHRTIVSWLPEAVQGFSVWGGSGYLLKTIHSTTGMPYWACFASISIGVRTALFPLVLYSAKTAGRFAKIAPDVQFQIALFQKDLKQYREMKASLGQIMFLMRTNMATLSATYKLYKVNPFSVFLSPLLQLPIFWYISIDLRKIVNGLDPLLAQDLVESSVAWVPDLTEADPWYGLPVLAGILLYSNMEVALGKRNMAGEAAAKADTSLLLKDIFQSLAVFMPCFTSQLPGGVQVYIVTSFCFTLVQSAALRTEAFRKIVGLPSMLAKQPLEGRYMTQMIELKKLEQKARELRGDGPVLGKGVLLHGWEVSFAGKYRQSSIEGSIAAVVSYDHQQPVVPFRIHAFTPPIGTCGSVARLVPVVAHSPYIHGVSASPWQLEQQRQETPTSELDETIMQTAGNDDREYLPHFADDIMEKANRGEVPRPIQFVDNVLAPKVPLKVEVVKPSRKKKGKSKRPKR